MKVVASEATSYPTGWDRQSMTDRTNEDRSLCFECVGEAFLRAELRKQGRDTVCFYCQREGRTFSIGEMANRVESALDQHFCLTASEPEGLEWAMMKEGDLDWERAGEPIVDVIQNYAEVELNIAKDIQSILQGRHYDFESVQMSEENPFGEDAHYAEREVDDAESQASWAGFERGLKIEARYFSRTAEWTLQSVLFHKAARVQPLDIPDGTEISARLYDHTEDGPEINYWVSEEVPPPPPAPTSSSMPIEFPFFSESLNQPPDYDSRESTLRLDVLNLEVHHVNGIVFKTETHRVMRHRFEKREQRFESGGSAQRVQVHS